MSFEIDMSFARHILRYTSPLLHELPNEDMMPRGARVEIESTSEASPNAVGLVGTELTEEFTQKKTCLRAMLNVEVAGW